MINRRSVLTGLIAAPMVVRSGLLMPIKSIVPTIKMGQVWQPATFQVYFHDGIRWVEIPMDRCCHKFIEKYFKAPRAYRYASSDYLLNSPGENKELAFRVNYGSNGKPTEYMIRPVRSWNDWRDAY